MNTKTPKIQWGKPEASLRLGLWCEHTIVRLFLQNVGIKPMKVLSHVLAAGETHLDWVVLHLEDDCGKTHMLRLLGDRDRSAEIQAQLNPNGELQHSVDVVVWAKRPVNQAQHLATGVYKVSVTYEVEDRADVWNGSINGGPCSIMMP